MNEERYKKDTQWFIIFIRSGNGKQRTSVFTINIYYRNFVHPYGRLPMNLNTVECEREKRNASHRDHRVMSSTLDSYVTVFRVPSVRQTRQVSVQYRILL